MATLNQFNFFTYFVLHEVKDCQIHYFSKTYFTHHKKLIDFYLIFSLPWENFRYHVDKNITILSHDFFLLERPSCGTGVSTCPQHTRHIQNDELGTNFDRWALFLEIFAPYQGNIIQMGKIYIRFRPKYGCFSSKIIEISPKYA